MKIFLEQEEQKDLQFLADGGKLENIFETKFIFVSRDEENFMVIASEKKSHPSLAEMFKAARHEVRGGGWLRHLMGDGLLEQEIVIEDNSSAFGKFDLKLAEEAKETLLAIGAKSVEID